MLMLANMKLGYKECKKRKLQDLKKSFKKFFSFN